MNNKIIISTILFIIFIFGLFVFSNKEGDSRPATDKSLSQEKIKIAVCPTYFKIAEKINTEKYEIIKTDSTAGSLALLDNQKVEMVLSGRVLKPEEPQFSSEIIGFGYSFISDKELLIQEKEMRDYNFFTDFSSSEIIDKFSYIIPDKISEVENVYNYLDRGIIITSVENTDYSKSEIVHIYKEDGSRHRFSRTPIIYYSDSLNRDIIENLKAQIWDEF